MPQTMKAIAAHAKALLSTEQAESLGRAVFATALLSDGHVALVHIVDHKRSVAVSGAYGPDPDLDHRFMVNGKTLPLGAEIERLIDGKR